MAEAPATEGAEATDTLMRLAAEHLDALSAAVQLSALPAAQQAALGAVTTQCLRALLAASADVGGTASGAQVRTLAALAHFARVRVRLLDGEDKCAPLRVALYVMVLQLWVGHAMRVDPQGDWRRYTDLDAFRKAYPEFSLQGEQEAEEAAVEEAGIDAAEEERLMLTANWMALAVKMLPARGNKGLIMEVVPKLAEGKDARYVCGGGASLATKRRVLIFEREGRVKRVLRPARSTLDATVVATKTETIAAPASESETAATAATAAAAAAAATALAAVAAGGSRKPVPQVVPRPLVLPVTTAAPSSSSSSSSSSSTSTTSSSVAPRRNRGKAQPRQRKRNKKRGAAEISLPKPAPKPYTDFTRGSGAVRPVLEPDYEAASDEFASRFLFSSTFARPLAPQSESELEPETEPETDSRNAEAALESVVESLSDVDAPTVPTVAVVVPEHNEGGALMCSKRQRLEERPVSPSMLRAMRGCSLSPSFCPAGVTSNGSGGSGDAFRIVMPGMQPVHFERTSSLDSLSDSLADSLGESLGDDSLSDALSDVLDELTAADAYDGDGEAEQELLAQAAAAAAQAAVAAQSRPTEDNIALSKPMEIPFPQPPVPASGTGMPSMSAEQQYQQQQQQQQQLQQTNNYFFF